MTDNAKTNQDAPGDKPEKKSYKESLNLPKTALPMKANLVQQEPQRLKAWKQAHLYQATQEKPDPRGRYFLHDGPPYANGDIHMGHLINKVLKDIVVKFRCMQGHRAAYVPGWDCHGLPIEQKVLQELGTEAAKLTPTEIRKRCAKYAFKFVKTQSEQFQRLGILGDFEHPYLTLDHSYEAGIIDCLAKFVEQDIIFRQKKPIHWCHECRTALAEAELEYQDVAGPSIFVNFPAKPELAALVKLQADEQLCVMIWTTTPWTLPANLAVMVGPDHGYSAVRYAFRGRKMVSLLATDLVDRVMKIGKVDSYETVATFKGRDLAGKHYRHPFIDRLGLIVESEFVTLEDGTGLVHSAPGHGQEDYVVGRRHGLEPYSPVDDAGKFDETAPDWLRGLFVFDANPLITKHLDEAGFMFQQGEMVHSYPHCWRSKTAVIYRATEQWFIAVDKPMKSSGKTLRESAQEAVRNVTWVPDWGANRIQGMLESRPDWCISRQRHWGVPIPAFYCDSCGRTLLTLEILKKVRDHFARHGADSWFRSTPQEILGEAAKCPHCGAAELRQEKDILDVWFESGSSWHAAALDRQGLAAPVELYLEGSDQHRGWFQSSLLVGVASLGRAPFKTILTHGFVVDEHGEKYAKSRGNAVNVKDEVEKVGADVLRLWVSSVDYQYDIRSSEKLIDQLQDSYRKVRNTFRFMLSNLPDFDPATSGVPVAKLEEIDRWILAETAQVIKDVTAAFEAFEFHRVYQLVHGFCNNELSSIYLDVQKDVCYCDAPDSPRRRSAQTAMCLVADRLVRLLAPILAFTADEIWSYVPGAKAVAANVHLADWPTVDPQWLDQGILEKWRTLLQVRSAALSQLEGLRAAGTIQSNMEAAVTLYPTEDKLAALLNQAGRAQLAQLMIVSDVVIAGGLAIGAPPQGDAALADANALPLRVEVARSAAAKCGRCWNLRESVGQEAVWPDLCGRCATVLSEKPGTQA